LLNYQTPYFGRIQEITINLKFISLKKWFYYSVFYFLKIGIVQIKQLPI